VYELKLDGYRMVVDARSTPVRLWSRGGHDYATRFAAVAAAVPDAVRVPCVVDAEVCALDAEGRSSFSLLQSGEGMLALFCFDLLELDGRDVTRLPLEQRRALLAEAIVPGPVVRLSHTYEDGEALLAEATRRGLEGVMIKRAGSTYRPGARSRDWLKLKLKQRDTFTVAGYTAGTGSRTTLGALVLAERVGAELQWRGDVGSGFSAAAVDRLLARLRPLETTRAQVTRTRPGRVTWVEPTLRCVVEYLERTPQGRLRAPVYIGLAESAPAEPLSPPTSRVVPSNPGKVFFPELGVTKRELMEYYADIGPVLIEHLKHRPFTMKRFPDGIHGKHFFQKQAPSHMPSWVSRSEQRGITYPLVNSVDALIWMVNMGCIDMNAWSARADRPDRPDWVIFDLDPAEGTAFAVVVEVAKLVRAALAALDLEGFPKTSGSRGIHVLVPIARRYDQETVRDFAYAVARALAHTAPDLVTTEWQRSRRHGVLIDANQNGYGRTTATVYSVRPVPGALVSAPLGWDEVEPRLDLTAFTMDAVRERLRRCDVFAPVLSLRQRLPRL
jgi:bifunctional non-homologous end joining protein LigD